jgi:hypothetical protein
MIRCTLDKIELDFRDYDFVNLIKLQKKKKSTHQYSWNLGNKLKAKTGNAIQKLIKIDDSN